MNEEEKFKEIEKNFQEVSIREKKLIMDLSIRRNEQLLLCTTTVFVLLVGLHKDFHFDMIYTYVFRTVLILQIVCLYALVVTLNMPFRTVRKSYFRYVQISQDKLSDKSKNQRASARENPLEVFSSILILPSFFLYMIGILILGLLQTF